MGPRRNINWGKRERIWTTHQTPLHIHVALQWRTGTKILQSIGTIFLPVPSRFPTSRLKQMQSKSWESISRLPSLWSSRRYRSTSTPLTASKNQAQLVGASWVRTKNWLHSGELNTKFRPCQARDASSRPVWYVHCILYAIIGRWLTRLIFQEIFCARLAKLQNFIENGYCRPGTIHTYRNIQRKCLIRTLPWIWTARINAILGHLWRQVSKFKPPL